MGASFIYLVMAVFCSAANEWISTLLNARAGTLAATLRELLERQEDPRGGEFLKAFYDHPIVAAMMENQKHPAYLPSRAFVTAVLDLATPGICGAISFASLEKSLAELPGGSVRTALLALTQNAEGDLTRVEANIENWFNDAMARASRSYKRRTALWTVAVATVLTVAINADTIGLLRGERLAGWDRAAFFVPFWLWISRICGWSLTIAAVSLGAPFWFNVLNRFVNPRNPGVRGLPHRGGTALGYRTISCRAWKQLQ